MSSLSSVKFKDNPQVYPLSIPEAQGVEFGVVCIVGLRPDSFSVSSNLIPEFAEQKKRIQKDLLYVALTRAINELHVLGTGQLSKAVLPSHKCYT